MKLAVSLCSTLYKYMYAWYWLMLPAMYLASNQSHVFFSNGVWIMRRAPEILRHCFKVRMEEKLDSLVG